jgi:fibronectin type 3 domain-containing protein
VNGATGYRVFRSTSKNGTYTRIKSITSASTNSYADTSVTAGKTYYYKVRAYRTVNGKDVLSEFSDIASKTAK